MEKNGAITSDTPRWCNCCGKICGNSCGCNAKTASAQDGVKQLSLFPDTDEVADILDQDLIKQAVEMVQANSKPAR